MKRFKVKVILVMVVSFLILFFAKESLAETETNLTSTLTGNNISITDLTGNNTTSNNTTGNNTTRNNTTGNNTTLLTNNISNYNNSSLPKTGIENSVPSVILVVVLGISAVYAYKKIQDYKNI